MNEWLGGAKILYFIFTGGLTVLVSIIAFLIRRELNRNKDAQDNLYSYIKDIRKVQEDQRGITAEHDKNIAVMNAEKVGRPELKEEMFKIQQSLEQKVTSFKDDIKEDIRELKEILMKSR